MKKLYLLLTLLCMSVGAWAQTNVTLDNGSYMTVSADQKTITVHAFNEGDLIALMNKNAVDVHNNGAITFIFGNDCKIGVDDLKKFTTNWYGRNSRLDFYEIALGEGAKMSLSEIDAVITEGFSKNSTTASSISPLKGIVLPKGSSLGTSSVVFPANYGSMSSVGEFACRYVTEGNIAVIHAYNQYDQNAQTEFENAANILFSHSDVEENVEILMASTNKDVALNVAGTIVEQEHITSIIITKDEMVFAPTGNASILVNTQEAGDFSTAVLKTNVEYTPTEKLTVVGPVNGDDILAINSFEGYGPRVLDLSKATGLTAEDIAKLANKDIEYVFLPDGFTEVNEEVLANLIQAEGGKFKAALAEDHTSLSAYAYVNVAGSLPDLTVYTMEPNILKRVSDGPVNPTNWKISGNLNNHDINIASWQATAEEQNALPSIVTKLDLHDAVFANNEDMIYSYYADNLTEAILPVSASVTDIPDNCFNNCQKLTTICIPSNIENIGASAFSDCQNLHSITTTAYEGDDADIITDHGEGRFTFSSNLKSIGSGAFWNADTYLTDVYVLATTAPKCAAGAFDDSNTYGNNGFDPEHPITRDNYNNQGKVITILHYPNTVTAAEEAKYTDVTRQYSIVDEEHNTDGDGNVLIWPTHAEFGQAYTQATTGVLWDGTTAYDQDYQGWHEFVLSGNHNPANDDPSWNFSNIKDNDWWTLCVPFDMTKAQFTSVFGGGAGAPIVKTMDRVVRNSDNNKITVYFDTDLYAAATGDNDIVIKKHESYLIKPYMDDAKLAQAARVFSDAELKPEGGVWPILRTKLAEKQGAVEEAESYNYTFMGGYIDAPRPAYCYYLGVKDGKAAFKWQTTASTKNSWKAYTSIIVVGRAGEKATDSEELNTTSEHNAKVQIDKHAEVTKDGENYYFSFLNDLDDFATSAGVKEMSLSFVSVDEDGNATAITRVNGEEFDGKANAVYSISGQNMGNSVNGLAKGMYIINGKKYMVK